MLVFIETLPSSNCVVKYHIFEMYYEQFYLLGRSSMLDYSDLLSWLSPINNSERMRENMTKLLLKLVSKLWLVRVVGRTP